MAKIRSNKTIMPVRKKIRPASNDLPVFWFGFWGITDGLAVRGGTGPLSGLEGVRGGKGEIGGVDKIGEIGGIDGVRGVGGIDDSMGRAEGGKGAPPLGAAVAPLSGAAAGGIAAMPASKLPFLAPSPWLENIVCLIFSASAI